MSPLPPLCPQPARLPQLRGDDPDMCSELGPAWSPVCLSEGRAGSHGRSTHLLGARGTDRSHSFHDDFRSTSLRRRAFVWVDGFRGQRLPASIFIRQILEVGFCHPERPSKG